MILRLLADSGQLIPLFFILYTTFRCPKITFLIKCDAFFITQNYSITFYEYTFLTSLAPRHLVPYTEIPIHNAHKKMYDQSPNTVCLSLYYSYLHRRCLTVPPRYTLVSFLLLCVDSTDIGCQVFSIVKIILNYPYSANNLRIFNR